jgi:hypothetical protein
VWVHLSTCARATELGRGGNSHFSSMKSAYKQLKAFPKASVWLSKKRGYELVLRRLPAAGWQRWPWGERYSRSRSTANITTGPARQQALASLTDDSHAEPQRLSSQECCLRATCIASLVSDHHEHQRQTATTRSTGRTPLRARIKPCYRFTSDVNLMCQRPHPSAAEVVFLLVTSADLCRKSSLATRHADDYSHEGLWYSNHSSL